MDRGLFVARDCDSRWRNDLSRAGVNQSIAVAFVTAKNDQRSRREETEMKRQSANLHRRKAALHQLAIGAAIILAAPAYSFAQQISGTPGSPGATATIDGKQLPPPAPKFGGVIKEKASESQAWWAPRVVPPKGAPNVLLIMTDDQGFGAPSTFGGVIPTPAMDRIAKAGLRYTNFHST